MSRGSTPRRPESKTWGFAVQFNAEILWHVEHAIAGYLRLPQPTPALALMRELH